MKHRQLGRSGLFVSEMCLGTSTFGGTGNPAWEPIGGLDQKSATAMVARAFELGINFFDTADVYAEGESEQRLGIALREVGLDRSDVVITTKAGFRTGPGPNAHGASRHHLMLSIEKSLRRLNVDYIDIYQIHQYDQVTPMDETLRALDDLIRDGKVRYIGCSNFAAWQVMHGIGISDRLDLARIELIESYYSIGARDIEREIVPMAKNQKVGLVTWGPLLGGVLTGKYPRNGSLPSGTRFSGGIWMPFDRTRALAILDIMTPIAEARNVPVGRVALAWLLAQPHVTSVLFGARNLAQLDDNVAACSIALEVGELSALNEVSALPAEYPGWKLAEAYSDRPISG